MFNFDLRSNSNNLFKLYIIVSYHDLIPFSSDMKLSDLNVTQSNLLRNMVSVRIQFRVRQLGVETITEQRKEWWLLLFSEREAKFVSSNP